MCGFVCGFCLALGLSVCWVGNFVCPSEQVMFGMGFVCPPEQVMFGMGFVCSKH